MRELERRLSVIYAPPGEEILRKGQEGTFWALVLEGHVEGARDDHSHAQLGAGAVLGEMSLFGGGIRNADVVSDRATLAVMSFAELEAFRAAQPALGRRLTTMLARACLGKQLRAESNAMASR